MFHRRTIIPVTQLCVLSAVLLVGCGGGSGGSSSAPPPPPPSSVSPVITASNSLVALVPGESTVVKIATQADNGGLLSMSLTGVPDGVSATITPASVTSGENAALVITTARSAGTITGKITVTARRGSGTATASVNLNVASASSQPAMSLPMRLTRTRVSAYIYDPTHKQVFYLDTANQQVGVASTVTGRTLAMLNIAGAVSFDLSPDNSKLYVGTETEKATIVVIETGTRQVVAEYGPPPALWHKAPLNDLVVASNGSIIASFGSGLRFSFSAENGWHDLNPSVFSGVLVRSGDHTRVFYFTSNHSFQEYDAAADALGAVTPLPSSACYSPVPNHDGSRFVCQEQVMATTKNLVVLDENFNEISRYDGYVANGRPTFSTDGTRILAPGYLSKGGLRIFSANASFLGYAKTVFELDMATTVPDTAEDVDGTAVLAPTFSGLILADTRELLPSPPHYESVSAGSILPLGGATQYEFWTSTPNVEGIRIGTKNVTSLGKAYACDSTFCIHGDVPPADKPGPVDVVLTHDGGLTSLYSGSISFGPQLKKEDFRPGSGAANSSTNVDVWGHWNSSAYLVVNDQRIDFYERLSRWIFPPGPAGFATVSIFDSTGANAVPRGFFYADRAERLQVSGQLSDITSDATHKKIYVCNSSQNRIEVLSSETFASVGTIATGKNPVAISLTPDDAKLLVANQDDSTIQVIDTSSGTTLSTFNIPPYRSGDKVNSVLGVTATKAYVSGQVLDLTTGTLSFPANRQSPYIYSGSRLANGKVAFFDTLDVLSFWDPILNTIESQQYRPSWTYLKTLVPLADSGVYYYPYAYSNAGEVFSKITSGAPIASHPTASLLYGLSSVDNSSVLEVLDGRTGRVLNTVWFSESVEWPKKFAIDASGKRVFTITLNGVSMIELATLPLSVGSAEPSSGSGGTTFTLHGTGFTPSTKLSFGSVSASVSCVDEYTLRVTVPGAAKSSSMFLSNTDGDEYTADGVFFLK